jgi:hypothetical protein
MSATKILREAQELNGVSHRLNSLGEQQPAATEAILVVAGTIRDGPAWLEVLVATKISPPLSGFEWVGQSDLRCLGPVGETGLRPNKLPSRSCFCVRARGGLSEQVWVCS